LLYWYGLYPLHSLVFRGMLEGLRRSVEATATGPSPERSRSSGPDSDLGRMS
jgi:hypothetical protein